MPTKQETFDIVVALLKRQGAKATTTGPHGRPLFRLRGDGGTMSPAGALIPDDRYQPEMEEVHDVNWRSMFHPDVEDVLRNEGHSLYLVWRLENIHMHTDVDGWPDALASLAAGLCLRFTH